MKLMERIRFWLGWCPKGETEGMILPQASAIEGSGMGPRRIIYAPQLNLKTLYSFIAIELLLSAGIYYYLSAGLTEMAHLLILIAVFLILALIYDFMSMPAAAEGGIVFGFRRHKLCKWKEIKHIELRRELIFLLRWVIELPKLVLHVELDGKAKEISVPIYTLADAKGLYNSIIKEWKMRKE